MKRICRPVLLTLFLVIVVSSGFSQTATTNVYGRRIISLNGDWQALPDPVGTGDWLEVWKERRPEKKTDFVEYGFEGASTLHVPGDFNTQKSDPAYLEGTVWYKKHFRYSPRTSNARLFIHFGAVNYSAQVYLNGDLLGNHEGGFTPFQFELTDRVRVGENSLIVRVNNQRQKNGLPAIGYDWFNYGGITRDVSLFETAPSYIDDYSIQLKKGSLNQVKGWVKLDGGRSGESVVLRIPELDISRKLTINRNGLAALDFPFKGKLWSPERPQVYRVILQSLTDTVVDEIGFRSMEVKGTTILLNNKPIFLKGVNIHEERVGKSSKAYSEADALTLLTAAKELGCNLVRLAHYPHSEYMVKTAEKMGLMVWDELPVYQHIAFADTSVGRKISAMLKEMVKRDKNRCAVILWSLSNETYTTTKGRNEALIALAKECRTLDSTRLVVSVFNNQSYNNNTISVTDSLYNYFDVVALNEYLGWYVPWQGRPENVQWIIPFKKPVIISEFGGEAKFGNTLGQPDEANSWREEYQAQIYRDQIKMFGKVPGLAGVCPWILFDYRSSGRMNPVFQNGYNRKGLLSEYGEKKQAWYVLKKYYESK